LLLWYPLRGTRPAAGRVFLTEVSRLAWDLAGRRLAIGERSGMITTVELSFI
jgi:hypothetical protein